MAFFVISTNEDVIKDSGGNQDYLEDSGMYDIIIKEVIAETSSNGSSYLDLWIDYKGQPQMIFNAMRLTNNDGSKNFGSDLFNKLALLLGGGEGQEIADPVERTLPIGKEGAMKTVMVLQEFEELPVSIRFQMKYELYEGKVKPTKLIRNFFRFEDKATASEIVNNTEVGKQYAYEELKSKQDDLKDGLTPEDIIEWKKNGRGRNTTKEETNTKPSTGFGVKRQFGKKS